MSTPTKTNHILLGLVGVERSGKDTIADHLVRNYGFKKYSLAAPIRDIGKLMFGWTDDQLMGSKKDIIDPETNIKPRDFLTWFGTEICQFEIYNKFPQLSESIPPRTIWANMMRNYIESNITTNPIIITDIRFKHEADTFEKLGGILIYVSRKGKETPEQLAKYDLTDLITSRIKYVFDNNYDIETSKKMINDMIFTLKTKNDDTTIITNTYYDTSNCSLFI
jgi:hypothetical protein